jgi:Immunity protein 8
MATKIRATLRSLYSPDADPLENFLPDDPFGILVQAMIGPADGPGEESFDFMLCTPEWFGSNMKDDIAIGRHHLFVNEFSYTRLEKFVRDYCTRCDGSSWQEVAENWANSVIGNLTVMSPIPHLHRSRSYSSRSRLLR